MAIIVSVLRFVFVTGTGDRAVSSGFARKVSLALLVGLVAPGTSPLAQAQTFGDVPTNHWAYAFIEELADRGVTSGCGSGDHNPTALFYPGPNCTGTPHVDKHAGSIVKNGSALFYVDLNAVAVADFAAASISFSEGGCSNGALGVQYAWPAVPNVPSVTGVPGAGYLTPITIDWR